MGWQKVVGSPVDRRQCPSPAARLAGRTVFFLQIDKVLPKLEPKN